MGRRRALVGALALPLLAAPGAAAAQSPCARGDATSDVPRRWPAPLDRLIELHARDVELRDALARVQAAARLRLSYSGDLLPLGRRVCLWRERVSVGDALAELLAGTDVRPVVAGADAVVLAPGARAAGDAALPGMARGLGTLDRVVVTGSPAGASERALPVAISVIDGGALAAAGTSTLAGALDQAAPGIWLWAQSPSNLAARYGSIRGASSFGVSYPKIYIDGIEVANPLLFTRFTPEIVERIEVIRGPQGAALYGADAISGVVNVVTRHDGGAGPPRGLLRTSAGLSHSEFAERGVLAQEHSLFVRAGARGRSAGLAATVGTLGPFVPRAASEQLALSGNARAVGARAIVSGTARLVVDRAGAPTSPLLADLAQVPAGAPPGGAPATADVVGAGRLASMRPRGGGTGGPYRAPGLEAALALPDTGPAQSLRQYTLGGTATFTPDARWTHVVVAGIDGYRLDGAAAGASIASAVDSALRAARGGADRGTVRVSSVARFGTAGARAGTLTLGAEHARARDATETPAAGHGGAYGANAFARSATWWSTTGAVAQASVAWRDALFVTGGLRVERTAGALDAQVATLPMLGASWVRAHGDVSLKLRGAYGKGIRPPQTVTRGATWSHRVPLAARAHLEPESQSGVEVGADVSVGRALTLHLTRFDQRASGLIQPVTTVRDGFAGGGRLGYELQNVGAIDNRGWELQGVARAGALAVTGSLALVDSRVARLASGYRGDLRPGDRMLEVPARTMSLAATWTSARWSTTWGAARASDWINYDGLALGAALAGGTAAPRDFVGAQLRTYWREYAGVTRVRGALAYRVRAGTSLVLSAENLLDRQRGEPDNVTVLPGRTVLAGLRADF